jgi:hypothetical protein
MREQLVTNHLLTRPPVGGRRVVPPHIPITLLQCSCNNNRADGRSTLKTGRLPASHSSTPTAVLLLELSAAAVKRFANYRRFEVVLCQLRSSLKKPSRLSSRLAARVSTYKLLTLYHQHSNASRCLGEHMHDALDGPAAHRAAVAEQLGARLAHAHVHARHDRMVLGRVEAHHAHR